MQRQTEWMSTVLDPFLLGGSILDVFGTLGRPQKFWCLILKRVTENLEKRGDRIGDM